LLHQVGDLFELNVKLWCQNVKYKNVGGTIKFFISIISKPAGKFGKPSPKYFAKSGIFNSVVSVSARLL
jgi:hypothetical protein